MFTFTTIYHVDEQDEQQQRNFTVEECSLLEEDNGKDEKCGTSDPSDDPCDGHLGSSMSMLDIIVINCPINDDTTVFACRNVSYSVCSLH